jgi:hypothetical protein
MAFIAVAIYVQVERGKCVLVLSFQCRNSR